MQPGRTSPHPETLGGARLIVVFDGHCGVCTRFADWVGQRDHDSRIRMVPSQRPGVLEGLGLSREAADREAWAVDAEGRRSAGAFAINRVLAELGGVWWLLARVASLPPLRVVEAAGYRWFARNRARFSRWGVTPACARPDAGCGPTASGGSPPPARTSAHQ
jgi:predicted DCC family thiol-disulfide oxidoreductase YuxK